MHNKLPIRFAGALLVCCLVAGGLGIVPRSAMAQDEAKTPPAQQPADTPDAQPTEDATDPPPTRTVSPGGPAVETPAPGVVIDTTKHQLEQWVETRRIIAQEKHDLKLTKQMLNDSISLLQSEIDALKEKIKQTEQNIAKTDKQYNELTAENEKLKSTSDMLLATVEDLESRMKPLLAGAPAPVSKQVQNLSQQIPADPKDTKLKLTTRFLTVIGILNEINKFNSEITVVSEMRKLSADREAEVTVMYLGASKAYYVGGNGSFGGVGIPSKDGWQWKATDDAASQIALLIEVYNNKKVAQFVNLPIESE